MNIDEKNRRRDVRRKHITKEEVQTSVATRIVSRKITGASWHDGKHRSRERVNAFRKGISREWNFDFSA
jgi:hypothetical protein